MKVTIDIDCTPEEARAFMGLPDVQPLQKTMMEEMERRMMAEVERFSPETMLRTWFTAMPQGADAVRDMVTGFFSGSTGDGGKKAK